MYVCLWIDTDLHEQMGIINILFPPILSVLKGHDA